MNAKKRKIEHWIEEKAMEAPSLDKPQKRLGFELIVQKFAGKTGENLC